MKTYSIENGIISIEILSLGAKLLSFKHLSDNINVVLRYQDIETYRNDTGPYLNATIGPIAGRLDAGKLGNYGTLELNSKPNHLHGGTQGLHNQEFEVVETEDSLICTVQVDHTKDGYPSKIRYEVVYRLEGNSLVLSMKAWPEKPQAINMTNHSYFNLDGSETIYDHTLEIKADTVSQLDDTLINKGIPLDITDTVLDFNDNPKLEVCLNGSHDQFVYTRNLDHYYTSQKLVLSTDSKIMTIETSAPGFQIYAANFFDESDIDEYNRPMKQHAGLAIEPQRPANEINYNEETPIHSKDHPFIWKSSYTLEKR